MIHRGCSGCRLRFAPAAGAYLVVCPECGKPPQTLATPELALGLRLFDVEHERQRLPEAIAVAVSLPARTGRTPAGGCSGVQRDFSAGNPGEREEPGHDRGSRRVSSLIAAQKRLTVGAARDAWRTADP